MLPKISKLLQFTGLITILVTTLCGGLNTSNIVVQAGGPNGGGGTPLPTNQWPNYFPVDKTIIVDKTKITPLSLNLNNDKTKNRINLFFYQVGGELEVANLKNLLEESIKTSKPINFANRNFGIFDIEPMRSNMDKFNFWYFDGIVVKGNNQIFETAVRENSLLTGLDFVLPIGLERFPKNTADNIISGRDHATFPNIEYNNTHTQITEYLPGSVTMYYITNPDTPNILEFLLQEALLHEIGHAAFGLADEYFEFGSLEPRISYPNCAANTDEAKIWWGENLGKVDPFFYEYRDSYIQSLSSGDNPLYRYNAGQLQESYTEDVIQTDNSIKWKNITLNSVLNEDDFRVTLTNVGGCFSEQLDKGAFRSTLNSFMNNTSYPIFGSVNRAVSEKILNQFNKPTLPPRSKTPIKYYENIKNLQSEAISPGDCQVILHGTKKTLNCNFENQNNMMSDKIVISYGLKEFEPSNAGADDGYGFDPRVTKTATCQLSSGVLKFVCEGLDITNLDPTKEYLLGLSYDATQVFQSSEDPYNNGIAGGSIFQTTKSIGDKYPFKYTILDTKVIEDIKPIITPTTPTTPSVITPIVATVSTSTSIQKITPIPTVSVLSKTGTSLSNVIISLILVTFSAVLWKIKTKIQKIKHL